MSIGKLLLCGIMFLSNFAFSERPFFCEKSSYTEGQYLYTVGLATAQSESEARELAFKNGKVEINNFFQKSISSIEIHTERTYTEKVNNGFFVCRLLKIDLSIINSASFGFSTANIIGNSDGAVFYKIKIISNPANASLLISGEIIGKTDALLERVALGKHTVILQREGYQSIEQTINVDKDNVFSFVLKKKKANVVIKSNVSNGKIYLNDKYLKEISSSSEIIELEVMDSYRIKIDSSNHISDEKQFYINPNETEIVKEFVLEGHPAKTTIISEPDKTDIFINGNSYGTTPKTITLAPGKYLLSLRKKDFEDYSSSFILQPGEVKLLPIIKLTSLTEAQKKLNKSKNRLIDFPWIASIWIGYGNMSVKDKNIGTINLGAGIEKKFYKYSGIKFYCDVFGGNSYGTYNGREEGREISGIDLGIAIPLSFEKGFYLDPRIGVASLEYRYFNKPEQETKDPTVKDTSQDTTVKDTSKYYGIELGWRWIEEKTGVELVFAVEWNNYISFKNLNGVNRLNLNFGGLYRF